MSDKEVSSLAATLSLAIMLVVTGWVANWMITRRDFVDVVYDKTLFWTMSLTGLLLVAYISVVRLNKCDRCGQNKKECFCNK